MQPDDHAGVNFVARRDEEHPSVLGVRDPEAQGGTGFRSNEGAVPHAFNRPRPAAVAEVLGVHNTFARGPADERVAEADQSARGDLEVDPDVAVVVAVHARHLRLAAGERLDEEPGGRVGRLDVEALERLLKTMGSLPRNHLGPVNRELVAFAAHRLDQDRKVQFAAPADHELLGAIAVLDSQRNVGLDFAEEPFADLAAGDELAFAASERGVVDAEGHLHGRLFDGDDWQRHGDFGAGEGLADENVRDACDGHDVARRGAGQFHSPHAFETEQLGYAVAGCLAFVIEANQ